MSEPTYLPGTAYASIAEWLGLDAIPTGIDKAKEAHRTLAAGRYKEEDLPPKDAAYVRAVRNWIETGSCSGKPPENVVMVVEALPVDALVIVAPDAPPQQGVASEKKSLARKRKS
jgi:hypothetical protein